MPSSFTPNKSIEQPTSGSYNNTWATPVNQDWAIIDLALGGSAALSVTGIGAGTYPLSLMQYQPPNIIFNGTLSANLVYQVPAGVGGMWTVSNNTTGAFTLTFSSAGGGSSIVLGQGARTLIIGDGTNMQLAQTPTATANPTAHVGLAAVNGTAATAMRSDAAPPIDQSIAPTWTGIHTFSTTVNLNGTTNIGNATLGAGDTLNGTGGIVTVVTQAGSDNSTKAASTAFVQTTFAPLASPPLTGTPTAPTASAGTNTTQLATTAFVQAAASPGSSLGTNGYRKNSDGSIDQWGLVANGGAGPTAVVFPIAFPTACFNVVSQNVNVQGTIEQSSVSATGFTSTNGAAGSSTYWRAIGN